MVRGCNPVVTTMEPANPRMGMVRVALVVWGLILPMDPATAVVTAAAVTAAVTVAVTAAVTVVVTAVVTAGATAGATAEATAEALPPARNPLLCQKPAGVP